MVRYVKQRNNFSCGPIAILNALKWSKLGRFSYKNDFNWLRIQSGCSKIGTPHENLSPLINRLFPKENKFLVRELHCPIFTEIDSFFRENSKGNKSIILSVAISSEEHPDGYVGHVFLISGKYNGNYFISHNNSKNSIVLIPKNDLKKVLLNRGEKYQNYYPHVWFLDKLDK